MSSSTEGGGGIEGSSAAKLGRCCSGAWRTTARVRFISWWDSSTKQQLMELVICQSSIKAPTLYHSTIPDLYVPHLSIRHFDNIFCPVTNLWNLSYQRLAGKKKCWRRPWSGLNSSWWWHVQIWNGKEWVLEILKKIDKSEASSAAGKLNPHLLENKSGEDLEIERSKTLPLKHRAATLFFHRMFYLQ